jgi:uncharacterized protein YozE (UPF0346 family)
MQNFLGFSTHKNVLLYVENDREVSFFAQSVFENSGLPKTFAEFVTAVSYINRQVQQRFSPHLRVYPMDPETDEEATEFSDYLTIRIETEINNKCVEH